MVCHKSKTEFITFIEITISKMLEYDYEYLTLNFGPTNVSTCI